MVVLVVSYILENEVLSLPDFDEALFLIPGLLNFAVTLAGVHGKETLDIEVQMIDETDAANLVRQALKAIPATGNLKTTIQCRQNFKEAGNLIKRVIVDKRGQNA